MDKMLNLVSIQPVINSQDILTQWSYYKSLINNYLQTLPKNDFPTFVSLPEYALGNKQTYNEESINKVRDQIATFAEEHHLNIVAGSHAHYEEQHWFNRAWLFDAENDKIYEYDKGHLFNFELKNDITPGTKTGIFTINKIKIKILICSDLWFPEEIRTSLHEQLDLIIVPAMAVVQHKDFVDYGKTLWHSLAQTRSKENIIPLMVSDWAEQPVREAAYTCGSSCIVDPSQRWTNKSDRSNYFTFMDKENEGFISKLISREQVLEYRKYRREVGLLPAID